MTDPIPARLAALKTTPTPDLKQQWRELFDAEPPPFNRRYLESRLVIPPFLTGCIRRIHAANFSFMAGVMPPMPMFGRSLLYVQSHCVAWPWASSMVSMMYWSNHSCLTVRL